MWREKHPLGFAKGHLQGCANRRRNKQTCPFLCHVMVFHRCLGINSAAMEMLGYMNLSKRTSQQALKITFACHSGVWLPLTCRSAWWCIPGCILVTRNLRG